MKYVNQNNIISPIWGPSSFPKQKIETNFVFLGKKKLSSHEIFLPWLVLPFRIATVKAALVSEIAFVCLSSLHWVTV